MLISLWAAAQAHITRKMMETLIGFGNSLIEINRLHMTHGTGGAGARPRSRYGDARTNSLLRIRGGFVRRWLARTLAGRRIGQQYRLSYRTDLIQSRGMRLQVEGVAAGDGPEIAVLPEIPKGAL